MNANDDARNLRDADARMRAGLTAEAATAPISRDFAERVIAQASSPTRLVLGGDDSPTPRPPAWRAWVLPLVAAVVIAILVGSAVTAVRLASSRGNEPAEGPHPQPVPSAPSSAVPPPSQPSASPPAGSPSAGVGPSGSSGVGSTGPAGPVPAGFTATDLTWISVDDGWALGTAPCASKPCTSILRTTDGGRSWVGIPAPDAYLNTDGSCPSATTACVSHLRFANAEVGYAFGQSSLFMTVDAGRTWQAQSGGALGLEIANGSALRLTTKCLPGCPFSVATAPVGSSHWLDTGLPRAGHSAAGELVRAGHDVVVADYGNTAGGTRATSVLFVSSDDGGHWTTIDEPCPQESGTALDAERDTRAVAVAPDESITALCVPRGVPATSVFTMTSTDGGAHFRASATSPGVPASYDRPMIAATSADDLLVGVGNGVLRSADGGTTWAGVLSRVSYLGFESPSVGRALNSNAAAAMLSTSDGGAHWTSSPFNQP